MPGRYLAISCLTAVGAVILLSRPSSACSTPVFRFALLNWYPDPYEMIVFSRGPLAEEDRAAYRHLAGVADEPGNRLALSVRHVDLNGEVEELDRECWQLEEAETLPWMVVRSRVGPEAYRRVWGGRFDRGVVAAWLDSPARQELARLISKGKTAVWVLLESGDPGRDRRAAEALEAELKRVPGVLELPDPVAGLSGVVGDGAAEGGLGPIDFSLLRVARDDPAERMFVEMLLASESDLRGFDEPIAMPVFGRGRVLYALVGAGINARIIAEACAELVAACSCEVKAQNPGCDLLMLVDWAAIAERVALGSRQLVDMEGSEGSVGPGVPDETDAVLAEIEASLPRRGRESSMVRNGMIGVGIGLAVIGAAAWIILRRDRAIGGRS